MNQRSGHQHCAPTEMKEMRGIGSWRKMMLVVRRKRPIFLCTVGQPDPSSRASAAGRCWFFSERYSDAFPCRSPSLFSSVLALLLPASTTPVASSSCALLLLSTDLVHLDVLGSTNFLSGEKWRKRASWALVIPLYVFRTIYLWFCSIYGFMVCYVAPFHLYLSPMVPQRLNQSVQLAWLFILFGDESKICPKCRLSNWLY